MSRIEYRVCADPDCPEISEQKLCAIHRARGRASRSPTTRAQNAEYYRERARILRPDASGARPLCHWGCGAVATTADHVVDVADGGGHVGNLVPACAPCNHRRGGQSSQRRRRRAQGGEVSGVVGARGAGAPGGLLSGRTGSELLSGTLGGA